MTLHSRFINKLNYYSDKWGLTTHHRDTATGAMVDTLRHDVNATQERQDSVLNSSRSELKIMHRSRHRMNDTPLLDLVAEQLALATFSAVAHQYTHSPPQSHHWIPHCYTQRFSHKTVKRQSYIVQTSFDTVPCHESTAYGYDFCYSVWDKPFYDLDVEYLFSVVENKYCAVLNTDTHELTTHDHAWLALFAMCQAARAPHPSLRTTKPRSLPDLLTHLFTQPTGDTLYAQVIDTHHRIPFTSHFPAYAERGVDGRYSWITPLSPYQALVLSSHPVASPTVHGAVVHKIIKAARRINGSVYGLQAHAS